MTAPLSKSSGAAVAQTECATAGFAPKINLAAQERATALSAVAQRRSKLDFIHEGKPGSTAQCRNAAKWKGFAMNNRTTEDLKDEFKAINDELYRRGEKPAAILQSHIKARTVRAADGRMRLPSAEVSK